MLVERMLPVSRKRLFTLPDSALLVEAAAALRDRDNDIVVVCTVDGLLAGVITKSDVVRQISHCEGASCRASASAVMSRSVTVCRPGDALEGVWSTMKERRLKNIPIVDRDTRPVGVLNARETLQALLDEVEHEEALLRDYVMCIGYH
jgi:CBS domain-containing protein